jgi:beta-lactamase regulating signal transducer with metallopeptidase domain
MGIVASLVIPFTASSVSVRIPQMTSVAAPATSDNLPAPPQTTAIERSRSAWSIAGTDQLPAYLPASRGVDKLLVTAWRTASIALALVIIASAAHLSWRRRRWSRGHIAGTAVYLSVDSGPAVVGFLRPQIVVPRWLTHCSPAVQELVIAHERCHLDAHDAQLLIVAVCLLVCMPWNPVLWWQLRRLRLAIEIDCDARVLSLGHPVARYGETLIAVGERQSASHAIVMARFGSKSFLERRIHAMLRTKIRYARIWATALACLGAGLAVCAAEVAPPQVAVADAASYQETAIDTQILDGYVGSYRYGNAVLLVTRDGPQLAAGLAGRSGHPIYPRSNTEFFFKRADAQISFVTDAQGKAVSLTMHRAGGDVTMKRIDAGTAQQIASAMAEKQRTQSLDPRRAAVLSRLVDGIVTGKPNTDDMRSGLATAVNHRLSTLQSVVAPLGAVQSVQYLGVDNQGSDVYTVEQEHGVSHWRVALDAAGLMSGAMVTPGLHSVLLDEDEAVSGLVLP